MKIHRLYYLGVGGFGYVKLELSRKQRRELDGLWTEAAHLWKKVLDHPKFSDHLRHRISELDDRQLDTSAVQVIRDEIPATLVKPLAELAGAATDPARLARHAREWPVSSRVVNDLLEQAAASHYETLGNARRAHQRGISRRTGTGVVRGQADRRGG